jgi:hypothetical protein
MISTFPEGMSVAAWPLRRAIVLLLEVKDRVAGS